VGKWLITIDWSKGITQLRHHGAFGAQPLHQQTGLFRDRLQALWFHRHGLPLFLFPLGMLSASHWLHALSLSIADRSCPLVWPKFPNRVINRHLRLICSLRLVDESHTIHTPISLTRDTLVK